MQTFPKDGLDCELHVPGVVNLDPKIVLDMAHMQGEVFAKAVGEGRDRYFVAKWSLDPVQRMQRLKFDLIVDNGPPTDWNKFEAVATVLCDYI